MTAIVYDAGQVGRHAADFAPAFHQALNDHSRPIGPLFGVDDTQRERVGPAARRVYGRDEPHASARRELDPVSHRSGVH